MGLLIFTEQILYCYWRPTVPLRIKYLGLILAIIRLVNQDINDLIQEKMNGIIMRSKSDWQEYGKKPSKNV